MFDLEKWSKGQTDKIFLWFNLDDDPIYTPRFKRFIKWFGYKLNPFILHIASFIILIWIFNRINTNYGFERVVILGFVIVIFSLRSLKNEMCKLTE